MTSYKNWGSWLAGCALVTKTINPSLQLSGRGNTGPCDIVVFGSPFAAILMSIQVRQGPTVTLGSAMLMGTAVLTTMDDG